MVSKYVLRDRMNLHLTNRKAFNEGEMGSLFECFDEFSTISFIKLTKLVFAFASFLLSLSGKITNHLEKTILEVEG